MMIIILLLVISIEKIFLCLSPDALTFHKQKQSKHKNEALLDSTLSKDQLSTKHFM